MGIDKIVSMVREWAASEPLVLRAFIFGSRARGDHREDSDLDVAVEIQKPAGDENTLATWIFEGKRLQQRLDARIPYNAHLQLLDGDNAPIVLSGVNASSVLVYERAKA